MIGSRRTSEAIDLPGQARRREITLLLVGWVGLVFVAWLQFMRQTPADQGRLLFPALLPPALAVAAGLSRFRSCRPAVALALLTSLYSLVVVIPSAYARPPIVQEAEIPAQANRLGAQLGPLELVAAELEQTALHPGGWIRMQLYWRRHGEPARPPVLVVEVLGRELELVGKLHSYHGGGRFPATLWPQEEIILEQVEVPLDGHMAVPTEARLFVKLLDEAGSVEVGRIKVTPHLWPQRDKVVLARFGDAIELTRAEISTTAQSVEVRLRWQVNRPPGQDLTTFVHLGEPTQPLLAQADGPALHGDYPARLWEAGEVIDDVYTLSLPDDVPDGRYPIFIGLYDPATGARLSVFSQGRQQANDAYGVGWFTATSR